MYDTRTDVPLQTGSEDSTARFDRDELVRGWRKFEAAKPSRTSLIKFAAKTDMGQVRENNEDKFEFYEPEEPSVVAIRGSFYAVADGIGGAQAGQIASELMLKQVIAGYYDHPSPDPQEAMRESIVAANDRIYHLAQMIPERSGMGTTLIGLIFREDQVICVQVGDSRAYLLRDGQIRQVSIDHSWVEEQVQIGALTRSEAETSPFRNVITRSIGASNSVVPDFYLEEARPGDVWVLCTDGLTGHVGANEIASIAGGAAPSEAARQLIELANARGGHDNVTVFVLSVRALISSEEAPSASEETVPAAEGQPAEKTGAAEPAGADPRPKSGLRKLLGL